MEPKDLRDVIGPVIIRKAKRMAGTYKIEVRPNRESGFVGTIPGFATIVGRGRTREECLRDAQEALVAGIATMLHHGGCPLKPTPIDRKTELLNIRITPEDKGLLTKAANQLGFKRLSEFIRHAVMDVARSVLDDRSAKHIAKGV